jgi:hypothetical protein
MVTYRKIYILGYFDKIMTIIDLLKYGKIFRETALGSFFVEGNIDGTGKYIGSQYNLEGLVNKDKIGLSGQIDSTQFKDKNEFINLLRKFGQEYLNGRFGQVKDPIPVDNEYFIIPVPYEVIKGLIDKVDKFDRFTTTFSGEIKHPIMRATLSDFFMDFLENKSKGLQPKESEESSKHYTPKEKAIQYVKDLVLWRRDFFDYNDKIWIKITERMKKIKDPNKVEIKESIILERSWSKNPRGGAPFEDFERVIVSEI